MKRIIVLAALALAACEPVVGSRYVKSQQMTASAGGELTIDASDNSVLAGTKLSIPPNALAANTEITVEVGLDALVNQTHIASPVVVFGPQTLQLNGDATIVLPLSQVGNTEQITIVARAGDGTSYEIASNHIALDANHTHATFSVRRLGSFQARRLNPCNSNADCASGEQCINGACDTACVATAESCNGIDDDCDGVIDNNCGSLVCNTDTDCASGQECLRGTCVISAIDAGVVDGGVNCSSNADCASGEQCVNGACQAACVAQTEVCNGIDDDCDGIVDNNCAIDAGTFCRTDLECANGETCVNNTCQIDLDAGVADAGTDACSVDTDCASGQVCSNGTCVIDNPAIDGGAFVCSTANDCAAGEDCINGACEVVALDGGAANLCRTDLDCASGQFCVNQVCQ